MHPTLSVINFREMSNRKETGSYLCWVSTKSAKLEPPLTLCDLDNCIHSPCASIFLLSSRFFLLDSLCKHKDTMPGTLNNCRKLNALFWQLQTHTLSGYQLVLLRYQRAPPWQAGITVTSIWRELEPWAWLRTHNILAFWWPEVWPRLLCIGVM